MSKLLLTVLIWFCFELGTVIEAGDGALIETHARI